VVLFALLAGAIGDLVDRRRFLLLAQSAMLVAAAVTSSSDSATVTKRNAAPVRLARCARRQADRALGEIPVSDSLARG
jgi:MFS family permease